MISLAERADEKYETAQETLETPFGERFTSAAGDQVLYQLFQKCLSLLDQKGADYTEGLYRTRNFDEVGARTGVSRFAVWSVYFQKHLSAIEAYIKTGKLESEGIAGRIQDAINYLALLKVMIDEQTINK